MQRYKAVVIPAKKLLKHFFKEMEKKSNSLSAMFMFAFIFKKMFI